MKPNVFRNQSDPGDTAAAYWFIAAVTAVGTAYTIYLFGLPSTLDPDDRDFNPFVLIPIVLGCVCLWHLFLAIRWSLRRSRFGESEMEVDGSVPVLLGTVLSGRIRPARKFTPTGDFLITLTCYDVHEFREISDNRTGTHREDEVPVWSRKASLPATTDLAAGLQFRFELPASVGASLRRSASPTGGAVFRLKAVISVPGLRKAASYNDPPISRRWRLVVTAPMPRVDYLAAFDIPVQED